ncbi:hypothetical protein HDU96_001331 [Phlyctochytrium bullatum]|nr:hypothetical protein HDU96_001331 [Phlyctochytrium bullatum]
MSTPLPLTTSPLSSPTTTTTLSTTSTLLDDPTAYLLLPDPKEDPPPPPTHWDPTTLTLGIRMDVLDRYQSLVSSIALLANVEGLVEDQAALVKAIEARLRGEEEEEGPGPGLGPGPVRERANTFPPPETRRDDETARRTSVPSWLAFFVPGFSGTPPQTQPRTLRPSTTLPRASSPTPRQRTHARISTVLADARARLATLQADMALLEKQREAARRVVEEAVEGGSLGERVERMERALESAGRGRTGVEVEVVLGSGKGI